MMKPSLRIEAGTQHLALVLADEQTAGRGRSGRRWATPPGAGLAFSLVLLSPPMEPNLLSRLTGLGAVAIQRALESKLGLHAQVKWPNDVLIEGSKVAGVLVEAH
jgi:BirA family biotin operon repressor/biotin-[acetyl-CoA-carboxylase] ligase